MFKMGVRVTRTAEVTLGTLFLASAVLKALDMGTFAVQVARYGVVHDRSAVLLAAWGALSVETALAAVLLAGSRRHEVVLALTFLILTGFTSLIAYAWAFNGLSECGCFGKYVTMSPGMSIIKNVAMMLLTVIAACGVHRRTNTESGDESSRSSRLRRARLTVSVVCVALVGVAAGMGISKSGEADSKLQSVANTKIAPFAQFSFQSEGIPYDLGHREYLVAMLSATCDHCIASVPKLNDLTAIPEFPRLVALMLGDQKEIEQFRSETQPQFPTQQVKDALTFFQFIGNAPPRLILIKDGEEVKHWDEDMPGPEAVLEALTDAGAKLAGSG